MIYRKMNKNSHLKYESMQRTLYKIGQICVY